MMEADETRILLAAELSRDGWQIGEAETEEEAFRHLAAAVPTVILLDPVMAGLDGFAFLKALDRNPDWRDIPVIVVVAQPIGRDETEELRGRVQDIIPMAEDGADGVIEELKEAIARLRPAPPDRGPQERSMEAGATNGTGGTDG
jgi:CheY-like chemotaxis protein